jgi:TrmH family RNA methyltransferase
MGNMGTIIRTMLGFGFLDLAVIGTSADIYHPDVIRASMGAFFQLRFQRFDNFSAYRDSFPRNFYPIMTDGRVSLNKLTFNDPYGLIFGSESKGLPQEYKKYGISTNIPQSEAIDSLNLAISVGITLYQTTLND